MTMKKLIAVILAVLLGMSAFTVGFSVIAADDDATSLEEYVEEASSTQLTSTQKFKYGFAKVINKLSNFLLNDVIFDFLQLILRDADSVEKLSEFKLENYANFYEGTGDILTEPAENAQWNLGYDKQSIIPDDFLTSSKKYARGSYIPYWFTNDIHTQEDGTYEDLCIRTVAINDGSGRGTAIFAVIDCVGISNTDIRKIRSEVASFAAENNIVSINIGSSHTHTGIDTQGAWNHPFKALANNIFTHNEVISGVDQDFLAKIISAAATSIKNAVANLTPGTLEYYRYDGTEYIRARSFPNVCDPDVYTLKFTPDEVTEESREGTYICSFGTHPEITSYMWADGDGDHKISADLIYYMDKAMGKAGYNFMFIQGNVGTNSTGRGLPDDNGLDADNHEESMRYGYEMALIVMSLGKTKAEAIALNEKTGDLLGVNTYSTTHEGYTCWYDSSLEVKDYKVVKPYLNIVATQTMLTMDNNVSTVLTKTGIADNKIVKDGLKYYMVTEVGVAQFGDAFKAILNPGELYSELLMGNCEELKTVNGGFKYNAIREDYGDDVIMFDLMNDAIGYIEPDNYYVLAGIQYNKDTDEYESESWCLLVSAGKNCASEIMEVYHELLNKF